LVIIKKLYELVPATMRLYFESCLKTYIDVNFFTSFCLGIYLLEFVHVFGSRKQHAFKLLICIYFWILEREILNCSLVGIFQHNHFPSNISTFTYTPIFGDWPVFLSFFEKNSQEIPTFLHLCCNSFVVSC